MPIHILKLVKSYSAAKNTLVFDFEKPAGLTYKPGQYAGFTLINPTDTDAGGITRRFSLLSTPDDPYLTIATRIQNSAYKKSLCNIPIGGEIKFAGPTGTFTLHEEITRPAVFIAGGIGIAPFYSMIRYAAAHQSSQKFYLFYGNQTAADSAFLSELQTIAQQYPQFTFIPTLAMPEDNWQGETGFINEAMIQKYLPDLAAPIYYICGSPAMVTTLQEILAEMGINEDNLRTEDFPGY